MLDRLRKRSAIESSSTNAEVEPGGASTQRAPAAELTKVYESAHAVQLLAVPTQVEQVDAQRAHRPSLSNLPGSHTATHSATPLLLLSSGRPEVGSHAVQEVSAAGMVHLLQWGLHGRHRPSGAGARPAGHSPMQLPSSMLRSACAWHAVQARGPRHDRQLGAHWAHRPRLLLYQPVGQVGRHWPTPSTGPTSRKGFQSLLQLVHSELAGPVHVWQSWLHERHSPSPVLYCPGAQASMHSGPLREAPAPQSWDVKAVTGVGSVQASCPGPSQVWQRRSHGRHRSPSRQVPRTSQLDLHVPRSSNGRRVDGHTLEEHG